MRNKLLLPLYVIKGLLSKIWNSTLPLFQIHTDLLQSHKLFPFCSAGCGLGQWLMNWFVCLSVAGSHVAHVNLEFPWQLRRTSAFWVSRLQAIDACSLYRDGIEPVSMQARQARNLLSTYCISNYWETDMSETQWQPLETACLLIKCHELRKNP